MVKFVNCQDWVKAVKIHLMNEYDSLILRKAKMAEIDQIANYAESGITLSLFV